MKAVITKDSLLSALETCLPICGKRHTNPVLTRVRFRVGKELSFMATDTIVTVNGARDVVECNGSAEFCVSADLLDDAIRRMPDGAIKVALAEDGMLTVSSGKRTLKVATIPADDYPKAPERPRGTFVMVPGSALASVLQRTRFAMSTEQRAFDGIQLVLADGQLEARAFDNRKVARATEKVDAAGTLTVVVPPALVGSLIDAATKYAADVGILEHQGSLFIETEAGLFRYVSAAQSSFVGGIREGLERETGPSFLGNSKSLMDAIKYTGLASGREAPTLHLSASNGKLGFRAIDGHRETEDEVDIDSNAEFAVRVNPMFFAEALTAAGETCTVTRGDSMLRVTAEGFDAGVARLMDLP